MFKEVFKSSFKMIIWFIEHVLLRNSTFNMENYFYLLFFCIIANSLSQSLGVLRYSSCAWKFKRRKYINYVENIATLTKGTIYGVLTTCQPLC